MKNRMSFSLATPTATATTLSGASPGTLSPMPDASAPKPTIDPDPAPHIELAESLIRYAKEFPWSKYEPGETPEEGTWRLWNIGFVRAGTCLLKAVVVLSQNNLGREAQLQLRAFMELVGNQYYMGEHKSRAVEFAAAQAIEQQRLINAGLKHNLLSAGVAEETVQIAERIKQDREMIRGHLAEDVEDRLEKGMYPFGRNASVRLAAAGMRWQYELPYEMASNLMHMNARAVAVYLEDEPREREGIGNLVLANEMMLRLLFKADEALEQGQRELIDGYGLEHARCAYPGRDPREILPYLRGEIIV